MASCLERVRRPRARPGGNRAPQCKTLASAPPRDDRASSAAPSGERKLVTLLFADLTGFTALASSLDPEEVYAFVRPGMTALVRIVEDYGGTVPR